jgi:hypothetical protein
MAMNTYKYLWPTKLNKFGIVDPFLKVLVAKYENEIPWQTGIRDSETLMSYVETSMFPTLVRNATLPKDLDSQNPYFVTAKHVNLDTILTAEDNLNEEEIEWVRYVRSEEGDHSALSELVLLINQRKTKAFTEWIDCLQRWFPNQDAFWVLVLRPIFALSDRNSRRTVMGPLKEVLDWLYRCLRNERLSPNENIGHVFQLRLASGSGALPPDGWLYISSGKENTRRLVAVSRGSGWCISDRMWASKYLSSCDFYILFRNKFPTVALRVNNGTVVECQGRYNGCPDGHFSDILFFSTVQRLHIEHPWRVREMQVELERLGELSEQPLSWWQDRVRIWPFVIDLAPEKYKECLALAFEHSLTAVSNPSEFYKLCSRYKVKLKSDYWCTVINSNPTVFSKLPREIKEDPIVRDYCVNCWLELLDNDALTATELRLIPDVVKQSSVFQEVIRERLPIFVEKEVRKFPSSWKERSNRIVINDFVSISKDEPVALATERIVNLMLNNEDGIFMDERLPDMIRTRSDFAQIRENAWAEALQAQPPLWFALPADLRSLNRFQPLEASSSKVDLDMWCAKVSKTPWLLTQKAGVPKSIRFHSNILGSYIDGWIPYLTKSPWKVWETKGEKRVYVSYGILGTEQIISAMAAGWYRVADHLDKSWQNASERTRNLTIIQLAVMRTICRYRRPSQHKKSLKVCQDILLRRRNLPHPCLSDSRFMDELRALLHDVQLI